MYCPGPHSEGAKEEAALKRETNKQMEPPKGRTRNFNLVSENSLRISMRREGQLLKD